MRGTPKCADRPSVSTSLTRVKLLIFTRSIARLLFFNSFLLLLRKICLVVFYLYLFISIFQGTEGGTTDSTHTGLSLCVQLVSEILSATKDLSLEKEKKESRKRKKRHKVTSLLTVGDTTHSYSCLGGLKKRALACQGAAAIFNSSLSPSSEKKIFYFSLLFFWGLSLTNPQTVLCL